MEILLYFQFEPSGLFAGNTEVALVAGTPATVVGAGWVYPGCRGGCHVQVLGGAPMVHVPVRLRLKNVN